MSNRKRKLSISNLLNPSKRGKSPVPPPADVSNAPESASSQQQLQLAQSSLHALYSVDPPKAPSPFQTGQAVLKEVLAAIRDSSDLFLPAKAALAAIVNVMDVIDRVGDVQDDFLNMARKIQSLQRIFTTYQSQSQVALAFPVRQRLDAIINSLDELSVAIEHKIRRGKTKRTLESANDVRDVRSLFQKVSDLIEMFQVDTNLSVESRAIEILTRLSAADQQAAKSSQMLKDLTELGRGEQDTRGVREAMAALDKLRHVPDAVYDAQTHKGCMEDTRVEVLADILAWSKDPEASRIFWMSGMAGTGKTTIAWSFCKILAGERLLGGSFFCSRTGSAEHSDVTRVIPTLARLLALRDPAFAAALKKQVDEDPDIAYKSIDQQIVHLLQKPLAMLPPADFPMLVFVIDALDECSEKRTTIDMLHTLITSTPNIPLKFFVTSRPERHIRETQLSDPHMHRILRLHEIESSIVDADIRLYLRSRLSECRVSPSGVPSKPWFSGADIEKLANLTNGLFIFASTAIEYVRGGSPRKRLQKLTSVVSTPGEPLTKPLDEMYELILTETLRSDVLDQDELVFLKHLLSSILALRTPLSVHALAELLGILPDELRSTLDRLHAVIQVPEDDETPGLSTLHASFGDFLTLRATNSLRIDLSDGHAIVSQRCFEFMRSDFLHFNVSNSPSSCLPNIYSNTSRIPAALAYACQHWPHHVTRSSEPKSFILKIETVFAPKFLFWLEVLSALGSANEASQLIRTVLASNILFSSMPPHLARFLHDANAFVTSSIEAIEASAPHIYISALPCLPPQSLISRMFSPHFADLPVVKTHGITRDPSALLHLRGHRGSARSIALSADGTRIVSGSRDRTIRVWDAQTGAEVLPPLTGHSELVSSVAFSADGARIVSGSYDTTIRVWDAQTGAEVLPPLTGHSDGVSSVAFSADGTRIVSGSNDTKICLYDGSVDQGAQGSRVRPRLDGSGWLKGPLEELIFWVPPEYRTCVQFYPCILLIGKRRVIVDFDSRKSAYGMDWMRCYRPLSKFPRLSDIYM